jgi:hypothetical protein
MAAPTKTKQDKELCRLTTPTFRVSYPHVFKAQSPKQGDKPKFSITMLFPKTADLSKLKEAIKQAKIAEFGSKENWPKDLESPVVDGDDPKHEEKEGYKNHWVIKASTGENQRPTVVDQNVEPITDQADFYPGCYAIAHIYAYVWFYPDRQKPMRKGVGFILDHVQKVKDGKAFGGKKPVDQVFSPIAADDDESEVADDDDDMDFK